jgi:hypothetical protein
MRARAARALGRLGLAAILAIAVSACGELDLGGAVAESPEPVIPPGAVKYRAFLMQAWQHYFQLAQQPAIGFGQVHQESRFDCTAVSPGGSRGCAQFMPATAEWINKITLTQYNGGGTVTGAERKACADSRGCDPKRYFDNVERFCGAAGRSAASCKENREYPKIILDHWRPMYQRWLSG